VLGGSYIPTCRWPFLALITAALIGSISVKHGANLEVVERKT